jgi:hypothetical protein
MKGILKGRQGGPRRVLFHGTNFIGKTTFASQAFGGCLLGNFEDDKDANMDKTPVLRTWEEYNEWFGAGGYIDTAAAKNEFGYKWVALDTIDALQGMIEKHICQAKSVDSMAADCFSYGKGNKFVESYWSKVKSTLDWLHSERGLGIILLAHSEAVKMTPPDAPSYERWEPSVCEFARDLLCDWCQEVFFGSFRNFISTEDAGFNRTRNIAVGGAERVVKATPTAGVRAKNRLNMPDELSPFSFMDYAKYFIPAEILGASK